MVMQKTGRKEYMCAWCGKIVLMNRNAGRPQPGKCPRKKNGGPHSWRVNRTVF